MMGFYLSRMMVYEVSGYTDWHVSFNSEAIRELSIKRLDRQDIGLDMGIWDSYMYDNLYPEGRDWP